MIPEDQLFTGFEFWVKVIWIAMWIGGQNPQFYPPQVVWDTAIRLDQKVIGASDNEILEELRRAKNGYLQQQWCSQEALDMLQIFSEFFEHAVITAGPSHSVLHPQDSGLAQDMSSATPGGAPEGWIGPMCFSPLPMESLTPSSSSSKCSDNRVLNLNGGQTFSSVSTTSGTSTSRSNTRSSISEVTCMPMTTPMIMPPSALASRGPNPQRSHTCDFCDESFSTSSNRWRHQNYACKRVPTKKFFKCPDCDNTFTRNEHMQNHAKSMHGRMLK